MTLDVTVDSIMSEVSGNLRGASFRCRMDSQIVASYAPYDAACTDKYHFYLEKYVNR